VALSLEERRLSYGPTGRFALAGPFGPLILIGEASWLMAAASRDEGPPAWVAVLSAVGSLAGAGYLTYQWLWCECLWLRVDVATATLEWSTLLTHGQVPMDDVLKVTRHSRWSASIEIRGHRSLLVHLRSGVEGLTAPITAGGADIPGIEPEENQPDDEAEH
jgi:hypothetical protein